MVICKFFIYFELSFTYIKGFYLNANNELCFTVKPQSLAHCILIIKCNPVEKIKNNLVWKSFCQKKKLFTRAKHKHQVLWEPRAPAPKPALELRGRHIYIYIFFFFFLIEVTAGNKSSKSHSNQLGIVVIGWPWWEWKEGWGHSRQTDRMRKGTYMREKKKKKIPRVWVTFISCRCESSTWEAGKEGWMLQQR